MSIEEAREIVDAVMNMLEHEYGVTELENFGPPTTDEIAQQLVRGEFLVKR